jgi:hypothetical protein
MLDKQLIKGYLIINTIINRTLKLLKDKLKVTFYQVNLLHLHKKKANEFIYFNKIN